jgi:hypothetical protein
VRYTLNTVRQLLIACEADNFPGTNIFDSSRWLANAMAATPGTSLFLRDTGHSAHFERPAYLAEQIVTFLNPRLAAAPTENWTYGPYFGTRRTRFADVTGDGRADAIVVNDDTVTVRRSTGSDFGPNEDWTHGPYFGSRGTFFADVTGDGRADAIVVNDDTVAVRHSF